MRARATAAGAGMLLAGPTALAFFSGGYFDRPRLIAALACWALVAATALLAPVPFPRSGPGRLAVVAMAALSGLAALSATWADLRGPALDDAGRTALYLAALLAGAALLRGRIARAVEPVLLAGTVAVVCAGLSERVLPGWFTLARSRSAFGRLEQPLTYWNAVGALAAIGLVLALRLGGDGDRGPRVRAAACAAAAPLGAGLVLTFSRGALLAAAAGVLVLCVLAPSRRQLRAVAVGLGIAALAGAASATLPAVAKLEGSAGSRQAQGALELGWLLVLMVAAAGASWRAGGRAGADADVPRGVPGRAVLLVTAALAVLLASGAMLDGGPGRSPAEGATAARLSSTGSNRYDYWSVAVRSFAAHPLKGVGSGGFAQEWLRERTIDDDARDAHGLAIETAAELGLLGLGALGALGAGVAMSARRALGRHRTAAVGPVAALTTWALHAQIDWDWEMPALTLVAVALAGGLIAAGEDTTERRAALGPPTVRERPDAARSRAAGLERAGRLGLVVLCAAIALPLAAALRSAILTDRAVAAVQAPGPLDAAGFDRVRDLLRRAGRYNPDPNPEVLDASLLIGRGRDDEAVASLERTLRAEPRDPAPWKLLAVATRRSDPRRSAQAERRALALAPRRPR